MKFNAVGIFRHHLDLCAHVFFMNGNDQKHASCTGVIVVVG